MLKDHFCYIFLYIKINRYKSVILYFTKIISYYKYHKQFTYYKYFIEIRILYILL